MRAPCNAWRQKKSPRNIAQDLERQATGATSLLRGGELTQHLTSLKLASSRAVAMVLHILPDPLGLLDVSPARVAGRLMAQVENASSLLRTGVVTRYIHRRDIHKQQCVHN